MSVDTVIGAFSADHVARITGLTLRQLTYWRNSGFFKPSYTDEGDGRRPLYVYSFKDVVGLRVLWVLKHEHRISLQQLRKVAAELSRYASSPWSTLQLMVCKGEVIFVDPATGRGRGVLSGQYIIVPIIDQIRYVQKAAADLSQRRADQIGTIERHRNVVHNARVFAGTRVPVRAVESFLAAGYSVSAILTEYPSLHPEDIEAVERERREPAAA